LPIGSKRLSRSSYFLLRGCGFGRRPTLIVASTSWRRDWARPLAQLRMIF